MRNTVLQYTKYLAVTHRYLIYVNLSTVLLQIRELGFDNDAVVHIICTDVRY